MQIFSNNVEAQTGSKAHDLTFINNAWYAKN